ncbi:chloride channel protein [Latilactobacillus graminis]|uniref:Chloride channel protein n=1 Tax=Latilactobacillus graminis TaxID=60519 RepID=A0ABX6C9R7_9LACO|nr:chloride channel protein [Latilactobacillus graminis]
MQPFKTFYLFMYGLVLSAIIGVLLGLFYSLQSALITFFWQSTPWRIPLNIVMLIVIGAIIINTRRHFGPLPQSLGLIKADLAQTGTANYRYVLLQMIIPAVILVSGTSLGPEATLVSSTFLYSIWLADKVRYVAAHFEAFRRAPFYKRIAILATPHRYLTHFNLDHAPQTLLARFKKQIRITVYFLNGVGWFSAIFILSGEPSLIIRIGQSNWTRSDLAWFLPLLIGGYLLGTIWRLAMIQLRKVIQARLTNEHSRVIFGGVMIFLASIFTPSILFSGQHNFHLLATVWQAQSVRFLILHSLLKLILLTICLNTGWLGGDIFPVLFASTTQAMAISHYLPHVDRLFVIGIIAISMGSAILEAPLVAGLIMVILFLPINLLWLGLLATAILFGFQKGQRIYQKHHAPTTKGAQLHAAES